MKYIKDGIIYSKIGSVVVGDMRVFNPSHETILKAGYEVYNDPVVSADEALENPMLNKLAEIDAYDSSSAVNGFVYNGKEFWLDKATRVGLVNSTNMLKLIGEENTTLWLGDFNVTLPCDVALQMLCEIEVYALKCYNKTAEHKANVNALTTLAEVENYDFTIGYPDKLNFDVVQ